MALSPVKFFDLRYDQNNRSPILFLKDTKSDRYLPVWIGETEALSIELASRGERAPRPLTHDLMTAVLAECKIRVVSVIIDRLIGSTYYANLVLEVGGRTIEIDCRPSDGIALALREHAQIFVSDELLYHIKFVELEPAEAEFEEEESSEDVEESQAPEGLPSPDAFRQLLLRLKPIDFEKG